ncbi:hypothetical protein [Salinibius halmophilus]|nr:hypothetical protein [Salinibius halmophilus]
MHFLLTEDIDKIIPSKALKKSHYSSSQYVIDMQPSHTIKQAP